MKLSQWFVRKHCPCFKKSPCPNRQAGCSNTCPEWAEWERIRQAERERLQIVSVTDNYTANANAECVRRKTQFRARKHYTGKGRKKTKFE